MICGLDISTTCIGWTLLEDDGSFVDIGHFEIQGEKCLYKKALILKEKFLQPLFKKYGKYKLKFYVEAPLKSFKAGSSMAHTIILLQKMNVLCCNWIFCMFDQEPILIMESSARKKAGITLPKGVKGKDKKQFVLEYVQSLEVVPEDKWALKRTGRPKDWCFDQADSFVVASAGVTMNVSS